jgi:signal transduction histidine kinase
MNRRTLYAFLISFLLLVIAIFINQKSFDSMRQYTSSVVHSRDIITALERLSNYFKSAQMYSPAYSNLAEKKYYHLYLEEAKDVYFQVMRVKNLATRDSLQSKNVDTISSMIEEQMFVLLHNSIIQIVRSGESWRLTKLFEIHTRINNAILYEKEILNKLDAELETSTEATNLLTILFAVIAILIILLTFIFNVILARKGKWLEGFLESILNTSQSGIISYRAVRKGGKITDFKIEFANKAIERLLNIRPESVIGKRLSQMQEFVLQSDLFEKYVSVVETGTQLEFEQLYQRGQSEIWFYMMLAKLEDGVTASFHDITHVKKYEIELKNNITRLEQSNIELEEYAYIASHDLQEPLRKIRTYGSYIKKQQWHKLDSTGQKHLDRMIESAERMSILITDILGFSGLKPEQEFIETDLNEILENVLEDLDLLIQEKRAVIHYDTLPIIEAIPLQMNQLFYNLLNNALKFSLPDVPPTITISSRILTEREPDSYEITDKKSAYCELVFSDNGMGFKQEYAEQIFGLFKRLNNKGEFPGSGIGLSLCRKVVTNHNGRIVARSNENQGASFYIILPLIQTQFS